MNKELIKKYKNEFNHWLEEGKILYKHKHSIAWWTNDCWNYSSDYVQAIIINDDFVEFRKALAEGKTIQFNNAGIWKDIKFIVIGQDETPSNYRIKPELPFKVGDWIVVTAFENKTLIVKYEKHIIKENVLILNNNIYFPSGRFLEYMQLWQPKPDEWCWFWDEHYTTAILAKFENISDGLFVEHHGNIFEYCEPFIGELPSNLKG